MSNETRKAEASGELQSRNSLMGILHRSLSSKSVSPISKSKGKQKRMLTGGQLSDLFRRLDKDGNGELDLEEFSEIIHKLKINASEDFVARIFRTVDTQKSGTLSLQEFVTAYQMIYTRPSGSQSRPSINSGSAKKKPSEFICAVRYGTDGNGIGVFEVMLGNVHEMADGPLLLMTEKRRYLLDQQKGGNGLTARDGIEETPYEVVPNWSATIHDLNESITRDSLNNKSSRSQRIYWWIDIAMKKVASFRMDKYIAGLGLPNDSKFRASFGQFGSCLPKDEKCRGYASNGQSKLGGVSSLSMYVQALWILGAPIVHHIPAWLDNFIELYFSDVHKKSMREYYNTRFGFFFSASRSSVTHHLEFSDAYSNSQVIADRLGGEPNDDEENDAEDEPSGASVPSPSAASPRPDILRPAPLPGNGHSKWVSEPSWLLSSSEIKKKPTRMQFDTVSVHLLNQGHGPCCTVTIREIDEEDNASPNVSKKEESIAENSKKGIIGRIITGMRLKLLENLCEDGITEVAGDLADSPISLAATLMTMVHNFSMNTLGTMSSWMNLISNEVDDLAVSKHSSHAKEMASIVGLLKDYVEPTLSLLDSLYMVAARTRAEEALAAEVAAREAALKATEEEGEEETPTLQEERVRLESIGNGDSGSSSDTDTDGSEDQRDNFSMAPVTPIPSKGFTPTPRARATLGGRRSRSSSAMGAVIQLSFTTLPSGCNCVPISFEMIRGFLGNDPCQNLEKMIDGDESLEIKGMRYWAEQLVVLNESVEKIKDDIRVSLEEKRNFFSFVLTVVTVFLAPLTILTGYWGMNFSNMTELDEETYKFAPGVKLLWVTAFVVYFTFTIMSIHFRILYSAT